MKTDYHAKKHHEKNDYHSTNGGRKGDPSFFNKDGDHYDGTYPKTCFVQIDGNEIEMIQVNKRMFVDARTGASYTRGITRYGTYTKIKEVYRNNCNYSIICDKYNNIIFFHRAVWESCNKKPITEGWCVDHINGNKQNNRPENLRIATIFENNVKRSGQKNKINNLLPGVHNCYSKFGAKISAHGKQIWLGLHDTEEQAYKAYKEAKEKYHGKMSTLLLP